MWASSEIFKTLPKANNGPLGEKTKIRRIWSRCRRRNLQGCQMACFQTKNPKFGQILEGFWMVNVGIFYDHLENFMAIWYNLWPLVVICYIFPDFGMFGPRKIWQPWTEEKS
jgi:hypothetical protein